ncbi:MAG TPA: alpha/beta hydrolase [Chitinophagaceae bacterium]|nr:alpha/beta hydrolase [Chitinophagaceae bacterium]
MKSIFLILLMSLSFVGRTQPPADWGAFMRSFPAKEYGGKKFRVEAAVKVELIDSSADAEIWVRIDRENGKMGFFYNMMDKPIRSSEWKTYSISGRIDKDAKNLVFGGLYHRKAKYYFDDFKLFIETGKDKYQQIVLPNGDFEGDSAETRKTWGYLRDRQGITISLTRREAYSGQQSFCVDASKFVIPKTYGNNDSAGHYAMVNGIKVYYEIYGEGEPLLLLHGNSSSIRLFEKQIPEFSKQFKIIAIDTRGQGKSGEDGRTYTYDLFAEDMSAFLDYLHLDSVNILGWSDGGNTGLIMAMKYPKKVKRLVVMGANVFIDKSVVGKSVFRILNKEKRDLEEDTLYNSKNRLRLIELLLTEPKHNFDELKEIKCPVLVVAGKKDIIKEGHTKAIAAAMEFFNKK